MAFNNKKFDVAAGTAKMMKRLLVYDNSAGDALGAAGYFPPDLGIAAGDVILGIPATGIPVFYTCAVSNGVVTATAQDYA